MKRVFAFLLSLMLVFSSFGAFAAEAGQEVQVTVQFTCEAGAYGFDLIGPSYPEELTFVKATPSVGFAGSKGWSYAGLSPVTSATCVYTFKVADDAEIGDVYTVGMEVEGVYDANYADLTATVTGEKVFVGEHKHTEETLEAVSATCLKGGLTAGTFCPACDTVLVEQEETAPLGHVEVIDKAVDPTCTATGLTAGKHCERCGDADPDFYVAQTVVDALGHDYDAVVTEPTCTEQGYTTYTCACGDTYKGDYVDAVGHNYEAVVTEPTCVSKGYTTYTCSVCGDDYVGDEVEAKGHKTLVTMMGGEATCTDAGMKDFVFCGDCAKIAFGLLEGEELQAALDASEIYVTIGADGVVSFPEEVLIPAKGHNPFKVSGVEATCTTKGRVDYSVCRVCGKAIKGDCWAMDPAEVNKLLSESEVKIDNPFALPHNLPEDFYIDALGHTEEIIPAVPATRTETGLTEGKKCSVCGEILVAQEIIPVLGAPKYTVEKVSDTRGKVTYVEDENTAPLEEVLVKITWRYTLANEDTISVTLVREVKEDGTFKTTGVTVPSDSVLDFVFVEVIDDVDADEKARGEYENFGVGTW